MGRHRDLTGSVALVTGASSGIGAATAELLAERGARVLGTSRDPGRGGPGPGGARMLRLDVTDQESVGSCVAAAVDEAGGVDLLVNNAGALHHGLAEETTPDEAARVLEVNLLGPARLAAAVLPTMRARRSGRIVNVGSLAAWVGEPGEAWYAASKAALARWSEALRHEVAHLGVDVTLVEPGAFRTGVVGAASWSAAELDDYDAVRGPVRSTLERAAAGGQEPRRAARVVLRAATARRPRARYGVGRGGRALPLACVLAPRRPVEAALRRAYGLPPRGGPRRPGAR